MSSEAGARGRVIAEHGACTDCVRRSWLLAELAAVLDRNCRADGRLLDLLSLGDRDLIAALGGRRREALSRAHADFTSEDASYAQGVQTTCAHDRRLAARAGEAPRVAALHVIGGAARLHQLLDRPVVAFVGRTQASDYGAATAAGFARGIAAAGATVASGLLGALGPSALSAAVELGAPALAVNAAGVDVAAPARRRALRECLSRDGCLVSELPCGTASRRWAAVAVERLLAAFADVALVVESDNSPNALAGARAASALGGIVAAVPGRVTSRASAGPHALLREGASLVTTVGDVLDLLCEAERGTTSERRDDGDLFAGLDPLLRELLHRVGAGEDTPGRLLGACDDARSVLRALGELELMGLLVRGDGGRYLVHEPLAPLSPSSLLR